MKPPKPANVDPDRDILAEIPPAPTHVGVDFGSEDTTVEAHFMRFRSGWWPIKIIRRIVHGKV